jgi:hypothetical protein
LLIPNVFWNLAVCHWVHASSVLEKLDSIEVFRTTHPVTQNHSPSYTEPLTQLHRTTHPVTQNHSPSYTEPLTLLHRTTFQKTGIPDYTTVTLSHVSNPKGTIQFQHTEKTAEITHVEKAVQICPRKSISFTILITQFLEKALKHVRCHL